MVSKVSKPYPIPMAFLEDWIDDIRQQVGADEKQLKSFDKAWLADYQDYRNKQKKKEKQIPTFMDYQSWKILMENSYGTQS